MCRLLVLVSVLAASVGSVSHAASSDVGVRGVALSADGPVAGAVVWLDSPGAAPSPDQTPPVLDQRNLAFEPHVLAVQAGSQVEFPNNDRVFHNVFSFHDGERFDLGLYPVGTAKTVRFETPGLSLVFCNIHPKMAAYVRVVDTPYFAVADTLGRFVLSDVPPGTYTWHAWRPGGRTITGSAVVEPGARLRVQWP